MGGRRPVVESRGMDQPEILEFCSEVAVLPLLYSQGRAWQAVRTAEEPALAARPPREVDLSRMVLL